MVNEVLKYVFWALVCVPILVVGVVLFCRLKQADKDIKQEELEKKAQKAREEAEKERERNLYKIASEKIDQRRREEHYY